MIRELSEGLSTLSSRSSIGEEGMSMSRVHTWWGRTTAKSVIGAMSSNGSCIVDREEFDSGEVG